LQAWLIGSLTASSTMPITRPDTGRPLLCLHTVQEAAVRWRAVMLEGPPSYAADGHQRLQDHRCVGHGA
jgi:hypothetical protein